MRHRRVSALDVSVTTAAPTGRCLKKEREKGWVGHDDGRFVFHGSVEIRALSISQKDPTLRFQQATLKSPLQITATDVDVEITPQAR